MNILLIGQRKSLVTNWHTTVTVFLKVYLTLLIVVYLPRDKSRSGGVAENKRGWKIYLWWKHVHNKVRIMCWKVKYIFFNGLTSGCQGMCFVYGCRYPERVNYGFLRVNERESRSEAGASADEGRHAIRWHLKPHMFHYECKLSPSRDNQRMVEFPLKRH